MITPIPFREGEEFLEAKQVAKRLGRHYSWIYRLLLGLKCEGVKASGRWYITVEQWSAFLDRSNGGSRPTQPGVPGARTAAQRRRDDERAARACELLGV